MPIIEIEHRKLMKMQFVNPIKMMVMANSKTIFYFALIVCVRKSIDTIVQKTQRHNDLKYPKSLFKSKTMLQNKSM